MVAVPLSGSARLVPSLLASALGCAAIAAALTLSGRGIAAGAVTALGGAASVLAGRGARAESGPRLSFADHAVERVFEAVVLGAVAWATVTTAPWTAAGALTALVASYMASYLTAKAIGLGFRVEERLPWRSVRLALVSGGLLVPALLAPALWVAAAVSLEPVVRHGWAIARQRETR
jgi:hypothetical protein